MKKLLLMLVAFVATMSASAQAFITGDDMKVENGWAATFTPVADDDEINAADVAQAADGSVYVASTFTKSFTFAGKALPDPEGMTSSAIVKYDKEGKELWAAPMVGNIAVSAMTVDEDGTLYAAGSFTDEVEYTGADGVKGTIKSEDVLSAFIAKVSKDGKFEAVKTFLATPDADLLATGLYYPEDLYVSPTTIKLNGSKLYVAANYNANVDDLGWKAAYLNVFDFMYMENRSKGIFSLSKSDLSGATSVLTVQSTERISSQQVYPEALNFDFDADGNVVYAFIGFGNLTLATPDASKGFTFETTNDDSGIKDHALVIGTIKDGISAKEFTGNKNAGEAIPYSIAGFYVQDGTIYMAGTTYGSDWFDVSISHEKDYAFVAAFKASDFTPKWNRTASLPEDDVKATAIAISDDNIYFTTNKDAYRIDLATGNMLADGDDSDDDFDMSTGDIASISAWKSDYAAIVTIVGTDLTAMSIDLNAEPASDIPEGGLIEIEQSQGTEYDDFARATLVEGDDYNTYTATKDLQIAIKMMNVDVKDCDYVVVRFAEPVAAGWKLAFWSNQDLTDVPAGSTEFKYVFAEDPNCGVNDGVLPQICMMTFFGGYTAPLEAKVIGIYKHLADTPDAIDAPAIAPSAADAPAYNLAGQPVGPDYKGIVIKNGKKVLLK